MLVAFWSVKGGVGVTVTAALCRVSWADPEDEVLLVDLGGDLPATLGLPEPVGPGCAEWLQGGGQAESAALRRLESPVTDGLRLLPRGCDVLPRSPELGALVEVLGADHRLVLVDCGQPFDDADPDQPGRAVAVAAEVSWLVVRACYLTLRRAADTSLVPTGALLVQEQGRALNRGDVADALAVPVFAEIAVDPAVARSVDAGLLRSRLPVGLRRVLEGKHPRG